MATIAAALIGAGSAYYAGRQAKKRSLAERQAEELMGRNAQLSGDFGKDMLGRSKQALDPVYDYFNRLATGDRESLMQQFGPELDAQNDLTRRAFQTNSEMSPRSGLSVEANSRLPMDNAGAIARLLMNARQTGIQGLGTLGTNWANLGLSGLGQGSSGAGQLLGYGADRRREQREAGLGAGESAFELFKLIQGAANNRSAQNSAQSNMMRTGNTMADFWGRSAGF